MDTEICACETGTDFSKFVTTVKVVSPAEDGASSLTATTTLAWLDGKDVQERIYDHDRLLNCCQDVVSLA